MTDLLELAQRVEQASGADRELDYRIAAAAHPSMRGKFRVVGPPTYDSDRYFSEQEGMDWIGYDLLNVAPAYTASLDAAMTLADGLERFGGARGMLGEAMDRMFRARPNAHELGPREWSAVLARFFTAACLRARASLSSQEKTL